jgi:hypothetical protein
MSEISSCLKILSPYINEEIPIDRDYFFNKDLLSSILDNEYNNYDELFENEKMQLKLKIKKLKKQRDYFKKLLINLDKATLKLEEQKSIDEEINETMKLIKKSINENRSHER